MEHRAHLDRLKSTLQRRLGKALISPDAALSRLPHLDLSDEDVRVCNMGNR